MKNPQPRVASGNSRNSWPESSDHVLGSPNSLGAWVHQIYQRMIEKGWLKGLVRKANTPRRGENSYAWQQHQDKSVTFDRGQDVYAWLLDQTARLRAHQPDSVDWLGLAEELEEIVAVERATVVSLLAQTQAHLLKWQFSRIRRSEHSWQKSLATTRAQLMAHLNESKILRNELPDSVAKAYKLAPRIAGTEMRLEKRDWERLFPSQCPWTAEQILDPDFFPASDPTANNR